MIVTIASFAQFALQFVGWFYMHNWRKHRHAVTIIAACICTSQALAILCDQWLTALIGCLLAFSVIRRIESIGNVKAAREGLHQWKRSTVELNRLLVAFGHEPIKTGEDE